MMKAKRTKAQFFDPMLLLATSFLAEGQDWEYELKLDGYRAIAFKTTAEFTCDHETTKTSL
jgi:ATP-dependent DNA ligase